MRIVLSNHARMRCQMRGIKFEEIVDCITNPDNKTEEAENKVCYKKLDEENEMLLLCFTVLADDSIKVVTVIKTSKIKKYLGR